MTGNAARWRWTVASAAAGVLFLSSVAAGVAHGASQLYDNLGTLHHPISTTSELAQRYFDQGLRLVYAFNHEEAIHSFEEASKEDPNASMPES